MLDAKLSTRISTEISNRQKQAKSFDNSISDTLMGKKWATYQSLRDGFAPYKVTYACWPDPLMIAGWDSCLISGIENLLNSYRDPKRGPPSEVTIRVPDEAAGREIGEFMGRRFSEGGFARPRRKAGDADDGRMLRILVPDYRATGPDGGHGWQTHHVPT